MKKPNIAAFIKGAEQVVKKHGPEILTGIGIAGMITTTVLAVRATPKALTLIHYAELEKIEKGDDVKSTRLTPVETVKAAWKPYVPALITGAASVTCLIGASHISLRRNAILATAYKLSETALTEYREKVVETIGEKKEQVVRDKVAEEKIKKNPISQNTVIITDKGSTTCYDPLSSRYFKCDIETIRRAENALNKKILHDIGGCVSVNEFYDELGIEHTETGDSFGWNTEWLIDLEISPHLDENENPCIYVGHYNAPKYEYMN